MSAIARLWRRADGSLRARIVVPTAVLFAATLAAMIASALKLHAAQLDTAQRERDEIFVGMVANSVTSLMLQDGPHQIRDLISMAARHRPHILAVSLIGRDGRIAYSSAGDLIGSQPWKAVSSIETPTVRPDLHGDSSRYVMLHPIPNRERCAPCHGSESRVNGWLDVRFSRAPVLEANRQLGMVLLMAGAPAFLVLIGIIWWLLGRVAIRPLHRLVGAMDAAAERDDLSVRADEGRPDELGVAARRFDAMLATLGEARRQLEQLYQERMVRAERFATVGELATGLAHEIKNPLSGLSGALELLAEDLREQPARHEIIVEMQHQVARLARIMESLLNYARPPRPQLRPTDVNALIEKVLFLVTQQRTCSQLTVQRELAADLPAIIADAGQLEQVLLNLCLNAAQALGPRGGNLTLRTSADEAWVTVEVIDDGPGVPPEVRDHLFRPFFTTKPNGTGLGLAICARIIAEHGGEIGCLSPDGGGALFYLRVPSKGPMAVAA